LRGESEDSGRRSFSPRKGYPRVQKIVEEEEASECVKGLHRVKFIDCFRLKHLLCQLK